MSEAKGYDDVTSSETETLIEGFVAKFFVPKAEADIAENLVKRVHHNIWSIREDFYQFNIIITSLLVIFDAQLFEHRPENKLGFYEELLKLNAHYARTSKFCLVEDAMHLRVIRGLEDFDYSEFKGHVEEFRELYPEIKEKLIHGYYPNMISKN